MSARQWLKLLGAGLGVCGLATMPITGVAIAPDHVFPYHLMGYVRPIYAAIIVLFVAVWALLTVVLYSARKNTILKRIVLPMMLVLAVAGMHRQVMAPFDGFSFRARELSPGLLSVLLFAAAACMVFLLVYSAARFDAVVRRVETWLAFTGLFGAMVLGQLIWVAFAAGGATVLHRSIGKRRGQRGRRGE